MEKCKQCDLNKILLRKLKIELHEPHVNRVALGFFGMVSSSCYNSGTRRVTLVKYFVKRHEIGNEYRIVETTNG